MIKEGKFNYYSNEELDVKVKNVGVDYFNWHKRILSAGICF